MSDEIKGNMEQEIYIYMDDSGKLSNKENFSLYGGLVFISKDEKIKFANDYRNVLNDIKCRYCKGVSCSHNCPEIKSFIIKNSDRRRILNLCKTIRAYTIIINNNRVYKNIMESKASKGRFIEYNQRVLIKDIVNNLIKEKVINPNENVKLIINIDQQTTKSNGYYSLKDGIYEELVHGICNFNYGVIYRPILKSLDINVNYIDSRKSILIQASDMIAGSTRRIVVNKNYRLVDRLSKIDTYIWLRKMAP